MSTEWRLCNSLDPKLASHLQNLDQAFALTGEQVSQDMKSSVLLCPLEGRNVYVKRYVKGGKFWRRYLGRSRVRAEWENLQLFAQWGINTPSLLAYGEEYQRGHFERGALITEEVPHAQSLDQLGREGHALLSEPRAYRSLARIIARHTRTLHDQGFCHNDLDWRNVLVVPAKNIAEAPQVLFFDCPGGRFWWIPFLEHRITKDLAHLDKLARQYLSLRQRLWFYHQYTGRKKLDVADKKRLKKIAGFFNGARYRRLLRL